MREKQEVIDTLFEAMKDEVIVQHAGSALDTAFLRGFNNITLSKGRNWYPPTSHLYYIWLAGRKVKRYQNMKKKLSDISEGKK